MRLKTHIGFLASDALEGRRTGTAGETKAVKYLSAFYKFYGTEPKGDSGTYVQAFEVNEGKEIKPGTTLMAGKESLVLNDDYWPFSFSPGGIAFSEKIPVDFIKDDSWILDSHQQGPVVFVNLKGIIDLNRNNPDFDLVQRIKEIAKQAKVGHAKVLLIYNSSEVSDNLVFSPKDIGEIAPIPIAYITSSGMKKLKLIKPCILTGNFLLGDKTRTGYNVIAYIDNGAPTTVILGGHLDHLGYGEDHNSRYTGPPAVHNGADDNASGTSAVLELARLLKQKTQNRMYLNNNYLFINFSGEEQGLYGSKYFTDHPTIDLSTVTYMINMDMIGRLNDSSHALTIGGVGTSSSWGDILDIGAQKGFTIKVDSSGAGPSDHTSFYRKDIPVLFFFTGLHADYHKPSDDANLINYKGEGDIINFITDIIGRADDKGKLVFSKTKEQGMGTSRFKVSIGIMPDYTFGGQGVRADGIIDGRAAQRSGLKTGDVIVQLGEHLVTGMETYMQALSRFNKGDNTRVIVKRGLELLEFPVTF
ncbi:MAG: M28 family peptidase [Chitinophagaceae bacterium]